MSTPTYATVAEVRAQLNDVNGTLDADLLETAIASASRWIDHYCDRRFWADTVATTRVYAPTWDRTAWTEDIATTAGLIIATDPHLDGSWSTIWSAGDYLLGPPNAGVAAAGDDPPAHAWWQIAAVGTTRRFPISNRRPTLRVTARFGWSAVPDEVHMATIIKAIGLFRRKDSPGGVAGWGEFGAVRVPRSDPDVVSLLEPYRLVSL